MTPALKQLMDLDLAEMKRKYPNNPYPFATKFTDKTANKLTAAIKRWIELHGFQCERISVTGRMRDNRKVVSNVLGQRQIIGSVQFIKSSMTRGSSDLSATILGKSVKIEVKIGKDRLSDAQETYRDNIERAGGLYYVARDFESFVEFYNQLINSI